MENSKKMAGIRARLLRWYRRNRRDLPWRRTRDPYRVWLSEIMLQQTRIETAIPYYRRFLRAFPRLRSLAAAEPESVLKAWEGLGYYGRARNLHRAARRVVEELRGRFPRTAEGWRRLPGVGPYTAAAVASIAFGERVSALDGNARRVLARLFGVRKCIGEASGRKILRSLAEGLVPPSAPGDFNQAIMELGARICIPGRPRCPDCPLRKHCEAHRLGLEKHLPVRKAKRPVPHREAAVAVVCKRGRYLMGRRPAEGFLGGLWEFPSVRVDAARSLKKALVRALRDDMGILICVLEKACSVDHAYSHFTATFHVYRCEHVSGKPRAGEYGAVRWIPRSHLDQYPFPASVRKILKHL